MSNVIDFKKGKMKYTKMKTNRDKSDVRCSYEKGNFVIVEVEKSGVVVLKRGNSSNTFKILVEHNEVKNYIVGEHIRLCLKKKLFYVYWEIDYFDDIYIR